jgi:hypothetical protein
MNTDRLIEQLAVAVRPVGRRELGRRIAAGVGVGVLGSVALLAATLGIRPDLGDAIRGGVFWMKWGYTISLSLVAIGATARLARPEPSALRRLWLLAVPVLLLAALGIVELSSTAPSTWLPLWLGHSWKQCPWRILALAAPIYLGLTWSFQRLAPTRLRVAGAACGLAAGTFGATVYGLFCPEVSAVLVLTWYSLGILLAALAGALLGPRLLRW